MLKRQKKSNLLDPPPSINSLFSLEFPAVWKMIISMLFSSFQVTSKLLVLRQSPSIFLSVPLRLPFGEAPKAHYPLVLQLFTHNHLSKRVALPRPLHRGLREPHLLWALDQSLREIPITDQDQP